VPFVRATQLANLDELTGEVHATLAASTVRVGEFVAIDPGLLNRVEQEVLARSAEALMEVRRRERATPAEVLAYQLI
jgi:hypothetical protein